MPASLPNAISIETDISDQIKYLGIAMYLWMNKTNNYGGFTEAVVIQHYCYHLLGIPLSDSLECPGIFKIE